MDLLFSSTRSVKDDSTLDPLDSINFDDIDITNVIEEIDFDEVDALMEKFQEDPEIRNMLEQGIDVREYSAQTEKKLDEAEKNSIQDYVRERDNLANLHKEIKSCDAILESMEFLLNRFQSDLGNISDEIRSLQDQSSSMSVNLQNRVSVAADLKTLIDNIRVQSTLVENIINHPIDKAYIPYLEMLAQKISFAKQQGTSIQAIADINNKLEMLRVKAVTRVREHLLKFIFNELRKPNTNVQIQQHSNLLELRELNRFLIKFGNEQAQEVLVAYVETMQKIYFNYFREYIQGLTKLNSEIATKNDLLGVEESQGKGFFTSKFAKTRMNVFSLGSSRAKILNALDMDCIVLHEAQVHKVILPYEVIFRSLSYYFKNTVTLEYFFDKQFFGVDLHSQIFSRSTPMFLENLATCLNSNYDAIGVLLVMRIAQCFASTVKGEQLTPLGKHFDEMAEMARTRFFFLFGLHLESIRNADPKVLGVPNPTNPAGLAPHYVTRRYAEFISAIHSLVVENKQEFVAKLAALRVQMIKLINRLSVSLQNKPKQLLYLINNLDSILSVLAERNIESEDTEKLKSVMNQAVTSLVNLELSQHFKNLVNFVNNLETRGNQINRTAVLEMARSFGESYHKHLRTIHMEAMSSFSNWNCGGFFLEQLFSSLTDHYTKFEKFVREQHANDQTIMRELVTSKKLTKDLKSYRIDI